MQRRLVLVVVAALSVAACKKESSQEKEAPRAASADAAPAVAVADAAPAPPPYTPAADVPEPIRAAIAATDRADADRALDAGRHPGEVFAFFQLAPGQKVGELFAGGGASTELIARIVGP